MLHAELINLCQGTAIGINRIREMVSFELGKETEKDVFRLSLWLSGKASEL